MKHQIKAWRREAILVLLKWHPDQTATQLTEMLAAACARASVPEHVWTGMKPTAVTGVLRQLENAGLALRSGTKRDTRAGRSQPRWSGTDPDSVSDDFPLYALDQVAVTSRALMSSEALQSERSIEFQSMFDQLDGMLQRHRWEIDEFVSRLRERLEVGK